MEEIIALTVFIVYSLFCICTVIYDKLAAVNGKRRVPERTLFTLGAFFGALSMYVTMQLIRHKTKHKSFMVAFPVMTVIHIVIVFFILYKVY